jgi:diguanylate cyclase (GGDEF)-like protein/PAS domain S-box-containing protein
MDALGTAVRPLSRPGLWQVYLAVGALITALYVFVPPFAGNGLLMPLLVLSPVVAILVGIRRYGPASKGPWRFFALGFALFFLGDLYTYSYPSLLGKEVPFPSVGDGFYVFVYPALMAGLIVLIRSRNRQGDRAGMIDSLIITLGLALLSWVFLIAPYLHDAELGPIAKLVSVAYPFGDILLLAAAIRLAVDTGKRQPAFYLLASSIVALLVTDSAYGLAVLNGTYNSDVILDVGWICFYLLWGAAALHPSMRELEQAAPERDARLGRIRLALLTGASLIAPAVQFVQEIRRGDLDLIVIVSASAALFMLVVARMAGLVRQHERSVARERILKAAGAALVAATRREEIYQAALRATASLTRSSSSSVLLRVEGTTATVVAAEGADGDTAQWAVLPSTAAVLLSVAQADERPSTVRLMAETCDDLGLRPEQTSALVLALSLRGETRGLLVVAGTGEPTEDVRGALPGLAAQVSLALESATLTEEVHRRESEARFGSLVQHASDLITVLGPDATVLYQSPSIERVLGYTAAEVIGTRFDALILPGEQSRLQQLLAEGVARPTAHPEVVECSLRHKDGATLQFEILHTNLLHDENVRGIVLNSRDVSERKAFERQLAHQAFHDPVTGLANRALFGERVRHAATRVGPDRPGLAVIFMDLDDFKTINDSLGHAAGDQVLIEVARRLESSIRGSDTAARFGGDEFAVLLEDVWGAQEAADIAEQILEALQEPLSVEGKELLVRTSLGISVAQGETHADADELLRNADVAMYIAKRDGKGGYRIFEPAMHEGVVERLELRADLQRAMLGDQLELHYQPVIRLEDSTVSGVEALLRWHHPERGLVAPLQFIPLAEEMGLIVPIGRWVLREGCRQAKAIQALLPCDPPLSMSVNLSVKQLQHSDIVGDVADALAESGLDAASLTLEITESVMMTDTDLAVQRLQELKALGVRLALDDFGTGYSSLSYLSRFPVDILKMDRSFLRAGASPDAGGLAAAVVALGETLALEVVAEGIEFPEQMTTLRDLGCNLGQGFYFAKPMNAEATHDYLQRLRASPGAPGLGLDLAPPQADAA